jgi:hypothetical protein
MTEKPETFRAKVAAAMVGHTMADIAVVLADALGEVLREADPSARNRLVEEMCATVARKASGK